MTMPKVTEIRLPLEAVTHDPFIDFMPSARPRAAAPAESEPEPDATRTRT